MASIGYVLAFDDLDERFFRVLQVVFELLVMSNRGSLSDFFFFLAATFEVPTPFFFFLTGLPEGASGARGGLFKLLWRLGLTQRFPIEAGLIMGSSPIGRLLDAATPLPLSPLLLTSGLGGRAGEAKSKPRIPLLPPCSSACLSIARFRVVRGPDSCE